MKALIAFLATLTLLGCAEPGQVTFDAPDVGGVKVGQRAAEQQRDVADCTANPPHRSFSLADATAGDLLPFAVSFVVAPGSGHVTDGQIDDSAPARAATPSGCRPRHRHHYYA